jgi:hypothetical protein
MKKTGAFTVFELLIALSLTSVVIVSAMQMYYHIISTLESTHDMLGNNKKVCLFFNALEHDITTALVLTDYKTKAELEKEEKAGNLNQDEKDKKGDVVNKEDEKKKEQARAEQLKIFFMANTYENEPSVKIQGKLMPLFRDLSIVNTNPLQVYGQSRVRLARVTYELIKDKQKSTRELDGYVLWRRETSDIENTKCKESDVPVSDEKEKPAPVRSFLVADLVKSFHVEYVLLLPKKQEETGKPGQKEKIEFEEKRFFAWGDKAETKGIVPARIDVFIEFWNENMTKSYLFHALFPVISFPTLKEEKKKEKDREESGGKGKKSGEKGDEKAGEKTGEAGGPAGAGETGKNQQVGAPGAPGTPGGVTPEASKETPAGGGQSQAPAAPKDTESANFDAIAAALAGGAQ